MKGCTSKLMFGIFLTLTLLLLGNFTYAAEETTVENIVANKDPYDGKEVSLSGTVSSLKFKTSKGGKHYTTFSIIGDSGGRINVSYRGRAALQVGQKVSVRGFYRKFKKVGLHTYYNEMEAAEVR